MAYYAYFEEDTCYVCLEECSHKSPCKCQAYVHQTCLDVVKTYHGENCTICKSRFPKDPGYESEDSEDSEISEDSEDSEDSGNKKWQYVLCYILFIFAFITYVLVNFVDPY